MGKGLVASAFDLDRIFRLNHNIQPILTVSIWYESYSVSRSISVGNLVNRFRSFLLRESTQLYQLFKQGFKLLCYFISSLYIPLYLAPIIFSLGNFNKITPSVTPICG
jgi:hypothetical protein